MAKILVKLRSSTLVETLVAMTIVSLVSGFSMMIFMATNTPSSSMETLLKAQQISSEMADSTNQNYFNLLSGLALQVESENLNLIRSVVHKNESLFELKIEVTDNKDRLIYTRKRLIYANH